MKFWSGYTEFGVEGTRSQARNFLFCYGTALNQAESPVITWVKVLGSYVQYLGGVSQTENKGFSQRGASFALSLRVHERSKAALLLYLNEQHT